MLGHSGCAHDRLNGADQHARSARANAGEVLAHQAGCRIGFDDWRPGNALKPRGSVVNCVVGAGSDAVATAGAPGQEQGLFNGSWRTMHGQCRRGRQSANWRGKDRFNVDALDISRLVRRWLSSRWFRKPRYQRLEFGMRQKPREPALQECSAAARCLGGTQQIGAQRNSETHRPS